MIARETQKRRMQLFQAIREFFSARDFLELDTPILSSHAIPESTIPLFKTRQDHPWEGSRELHLLPSPEYYIKQLLASGWGNVFQLGKCFRNGENSGRIHSPEFTMLEYYWDGKSYLESMDLTRELIEDLSRRCKLDPGPFTRISMAEAFDRHTGLDLERLCGKGTQPDERDREAMFEACSRLGLNPAAADGFEALFNRIFLNLVEPELDSSKGPLFLYDYPAKLQSLSRNKPGTPWTERWELYWQGIELANCFSEETDPDQIEAFFRHELDAIPEGSVIADPGYHHRLKGMGPSSGTALGVDRLVMILLGARGIADVMLFPLGQSS